MKVYSFTTSNINAIIEQSIGILESLSFQVLDADFKMKMIDAVNEETKVFGSLLNLQFAALSENHFQLSIEARTIGLELIKDPRNKKLEQNVLELFVKNI